MAPLVTPQVLAVSVLASTDPTPLTLVPTPELTLELA
jgi:hypothetical protein